MEVYFGDGKLSSPDVVESLELEKQEQRDTLRHSFSDTPALAGGVCGGMLDGATPVAECGAELPRMPRLGTPLKSWLWPITGKDFVRLAAFLQ